VKKLNFIILFFLPILLISCNSNNIEKDAIKTTLPTRTVSSLPSNTVIKISENSTPNSIIQQSYNASEWKSLYNKDLVFQVELDSKQQIWILTAGGKLGYYNGKDWKMLTAKDLGLQTNPSSMVIAPDDTIWVTDSNSLAKFQGGKWITYLIPASGNSASPRVTLDPENNVWVTLFLCNCPDSIRKFDGTNWDFDLWPDEFAGVASHLLFTSDGTLWASFTKTIGSYDGKTWKRYSGNDLWPESEGITIASDKQGNIYTSYEGQKSLVKIKNDGSITKIPFPYENLSFNPILVRLFIDSNGTIWTNACEEFAKCLTYYEDNKWFIIKNLPFNSMFDMKELSDGSYLVATSQGLFQYNPEK
jgi:streptogramin lyase